MIAEVKKFKNKVVEFVDNGATRVEEIHKSIAEIPFRAVEDAATADVKSAVEPIRNAHGSMIGSVYDTIRSINRHVGEFSDQLIESFEETHKECA